MSGEVQTSAEYIKHHLQNLTYGQLPDGSWGIAQSPDQAKEMGFWAIHLDTMGFSIGLGVLFLYIFPPCCETGKRRRAGWAAEFRRVDR